MRRTYLFYIFLFFMCMVTIWCGRIGNRTEAAKLFINTAIEGNKDKLLSFGVPAGYIIRSAINVAKSTSHNISSNFKDMAKKRLQAMNYKNVVSMIKFFKGAKLKNMKFLDIGQKGMEEREIKGLKRFGRDFDITSSGDVRVLCGDIEANLRIIRFKRKWVLTDFSTDYHRERYFK